MRIVACLSIAWLLAAAVSAGAKTTVYKCTKKDGSIAFQDQPCDAKAKQQRLNLPDQPSPAAPAPAPTEKPPPSPPRLPPIRPPEHAQIPPPAFYLCTRHDGSRYISDTGQPHSTAVPVGVLGVANQDLAHAYGPGGIGVSAPGLRQIPHLPASSVPFGGTYTWIDDQCHFAAPREACPYLQSQLDDVESKLRRAFSDEEANLKQQQSTLRERMRGC